MLEEILNNLQTEYDCYEINGKIYKSSDLYKFICNIYHYLQKNNPTKQNVVVYGHKDIYMIATFLACAFSGITYIPIDESCPEDRKNSIINKVSPCFIIDQNIENIMYADDYDYIDKICTNLNNTYYMIFTSGSTGEPKGVKISYSNISSCIDWLKSISNIRNGVVVNQANFSFDLSVADIYLSLATKSKHFILEKQIQKDFSQMFNQLKNSNANIIVCTPTFADLLLLDSSFNEINLPHLKEILFCGEKLKTKTVKKLQERFPLINIINSYGPTECTFAVTSYIVDDPEDISVGYSKKDSPIFIVNENLEILKDNEIGEILITGKSVGQGYLNPPVNDGYILFNGEKAYKTGDFGYKQNNKIYCIGRKDSQIKLGGYRIELTEIENILNSFDFVETAIVTTKNKDDIVKKIVAFIKVSENISEKVILDKLSKKIPNYMMPIIKIIDTIPLNTNGKTDINKLMKEYF